MNPDDLASSDADLRTLRAITLLKTEIIAQLNAGLANLQICISQLTESHHRTILEQERRNATFAPQTRLEELITQVHDHGNKIQVNNTTAVLMDRDIAALKAQLDSDENDSHNRHFGLMTTAAGWVFSIVMLLLSIGIGFLVAHVH